MLKFGLEKNEWFSHMFSIRKLWIPCYFRDLFLGGILRSTQISESENNFFTRFTNPNCNLVELWFRVESTMDSQRHDQDKLNSESKRTKPQFVTRLLLEKHASLVYTHKIFYKFQHEFQHATFNCGVSKVNISGQEIVDNTRKRTYALSYIITSNSVSCSYKMFELMGLSCRRILFVMKGNFFVRNSKAIYIE